MAIKGLRTRFSGLQEFSKKQRAKINDVFWGSLPSQFRPVLYVQIIYSYEDKHICK